MNPVNLTPDMLRTLLQHTNESPLPTTVASPLLDFVHETLRNADDLNEAALVLTDAGEITYCAHRLTDGGHTIASAVQEAFDLQYGAGTDPDEQVKEIIRAAATATTDRHTVLADTAELLARLGHTLHTPEDDR